MTETARRDRFETTEWVARCPECGGELRGNYTVVGDAVSEQRSSQVGTPVSCRDCGWTGTIEPHIEWTQVG